MSFLFYIHWWIKQISSNHSKGFGDPLPLCIKIYRPCVEAIPPRTPTWVSGKSTTPIWIFHLIWFFVQNLKITWENRKIFLGEGSQTPQMFLNIINCYSILQAINQIWYSKLVKAFFKSLSFLLTREYSRALDIKCNASKIFSRLSWWFSRKSKKYNPYPRFWKDGVRGRGDSFYTRTVNPPANFKGTRILINFCISVKYGFG